MECKCLFRRLYDAGDFRINSGRMPYQRGRVLHHRNYVRAFLDGTRPVFQDLVHLHHCDIGCIYTSLFDTKIYPPLEYIPRQ